MKTIYRTRFGSFGFTLIELLVVIAIISLLVSILLPSLQKAKELARGVACMGNMNSLGLAITMYLDDNGEYLPSAYVDPTWRGWPRALKEAGMIDNYAVTSCPGGGGTKLLVETSGSNPLYVYGFNAAPMRHGGGAWYDKNNGRYPLKEFLSVNSTRPELPSATPLVGDTVHGGVRQWVEWQCVHADGFPRNPPSKVLHTRHSGRGNVLLVDGHCETWSVDDALDCAWHPMGATDIP